MLVSSAQVAPIGINYAKAAVLIMPRVRLPTHVMHVIHPQSLPHVPCIFVCNPPDMQARRSPSEKHSLPVMVAMTELNSRAPEAWAPATGQAQALTTAWTCLG